MFSATHEHAYGDTGGGATARSYSLIASLGAQRKKFVKRFAKQSLIPPGPWGEGTKGKWHLHPSPNAIDDESAPKSCVRIDEESSHWGIFPMG